MCDIKGGDGNVWYGNGFGYCVVYRTFVEHLVTIPQQLSR